MGSQQHVVIAVFILLNDRGQSVSVLNLFKLNFTLCNFSDNNYGRWRKYEVKVHRNKLQNPTNTYTRKCDPNSNVTRNLSVVKMKLTRSATGTESRKHRWLFLFTKYFISVLNFLSQTAPSNSLTGKILRLHFFSGFAKKIKSYFNKLAIWNFGLWFSKEFQQPNEWVNELKHGKKNYNIESDSGDGGGDVIMEPASSSVQLNVNGWTRQRREYEQKDLN